MASHLEATKNKQISASLGPPWLERGRDMARLRKRSVRLKQLYPYILLARRAKPGRRCYSIYIYVYIIIYGSIQIVLYIWFLLFQRKASPKAEAFLSANIFLDCI
uniref:Uncharacterized protein ORF104_1 n=1 Tax=Nothoceros aenigmaticus TaxID=13813 RepID=C3RYM9_9EMBR|nr:hypothetical protein MeaeMp23 [Nothoceros aenigmaticus]ACC86785.1 hypothetical protein MeaeMp23 [Nothoceros aenigmaticus]